MSAESIQQNLKVGMTDAGHHCWPRGKAIPALSPLDVLSHPSLSPQQSQHLVRYIPHQASFASVVAAAADRTPHIPRTSVG